MKKTLKITESTHQQLLIIKAKTGSKSIDETLTEIIKWWNWWKQPGSGRGKEQGK